MDRPAVHFLESGAQNLMTRDDVVKGLPKGRGIEGASEEERDRTIQDRTAEFQRMQEPQSLLCKRKRIR